MQEVRAFGRRRRLRTDDLSARLKLTQHDKVPMMASVRMLVRMRAVHAVPPLCLGQCGVVYKGVHSPPRHLGG